MFQLWFDTLPTVLLLLLFFKYTFFYYLKQIILFIFICQRHLVFVFYFIR